MGGTAVTSCLGVCGFVKWQAGILDEKLCTVQTELKTEFSAVQTDLTDLSKQQAELNGQLKLLIGKLWNSCCRSDACWISADLS